LGFWAAIAFKSDLNKTTSVRLAAVFQPVILITHEKKKEENIEDPAFRRLSQDVLIFLIENQDNFVIGMVGTEIEVTKFERCLKILAEILVSEGRLPLLKAYLTSVQGRCSGILVSCWE
jgi:hypothetical protein